MKRLVYIVLSVCSLILTVQCADSKGDVFGQYEPSTQPIEFSVFKASAVQTGQAQTRGCVNTYDRIFGTTNASGDFTAGPGIGIFAFHQPAKSNGYAVDYNHNMGEPGFMYNQQLRGAVNMNGDRFWIYYPIKYWPNNVNDKLSFFAYAPYNASTSWDEDMDITCNIDGTRFRKTYSIYSEATDQKDYLWADPVLNQKKGAIDGEIQFEFNHVCARLGFMVGVCQDAPVATGNTPTAWTDPDTYIRVNSITLRRAYTTLSLLYIYDRDDATDVVTTSKNWTCTGTQAVTLTANAVDALSEMQNNRIDITTWGNAYWQSQTPATPGYKQLNKEDTYMFLAPQKAADQDIEFTLDYDFVTVNLKGSGTITVHRTYTHKLSGMVGVNNGFEAGKAYTIKYLIGTGHIQVSAVETDWDNNNVIITME